jgi:hypothetical protein
VKKSCSPAVLRSCSQEKGIKTVEVIEVLLNGFNNFPSEAQPDTPVDGNKIFSLPLFLKKFV